MAPIGQNDNTIFSIIFFGCAVLINQEYYPTFTTNVFFYFIFFFVEWARGLQNLNF